MAGAFQRLLSAQRTLDLTVSTLLFLGLIASVAAQESPEPVNCTITGAFHKPGDAFDVRQWINRGLCVRKGNYDQCLANLVGVLENLSVLHQTEYAAAASVLLLLPTIGAFFSAPTNEIWTLFTMIPFGGALATLLSFGGTIMSGKLKDYQATLPKHTIILDRDLASDSGAFSGAGESLEDEKSGLEAMKLKVRDRLNGKNNQDRVRGSAVLGFLVMGLLLIGTQVGIGIVEAGSVYSNGCTINFWFHLWYLLGTPSSALVFFG